MSLDNKREQDTSPKYKNKLVERRPLRSSVNVDPGPTPKFDLLEVPYGTQSISSKFQGNSFTSGSIVEITSGRMGTLKFKIDQR